MYTTTAEIATLYCLNNDVFMALIFNNFSLQYYTYKETMYVTITILFVMYATSKLVSIYLIQVVCQHYK